MSLPQKLCFTKHSEKLSHETMPLVASVPLASAVCKETFSFVVGFAGLLQKLKAQERED